MTRALRLSLALLLAMPLAAAPMMAPVVAAPAEGAAPTAAPAATAEMFRGRQALPLDDARIRQLQAFLAESMASLGVPGLSFALIDANSVVFEGGLGVRQVERPDMVDADTLFLTGSTTTALSTLLLAQLVDDGRLSWEQPVSQLQPTYRLGDAAYTRQLRVRDLLCSSSELPVNTLPWLAQSRSLTPTGLLNPAAPLQPLGPPGQRFVFGMPLASVAGYIGGLLANPRLEPGRAYDLAMQDRVLRPLGMRASTFDPQRALSGNHAVPHGFGPDGKPARAADVAAFAVSAYRPAGGLWTSARELVRFAQLELQLGRLPNGRQMVSQENLLLRRLPQTLVNADRRYGLGLEVDRSWGVQVVHAGGEPGGYSSDVFLLPEYGVGMVLLTNSAAGTRLRWPFMHRLLEVLFTEDAASVRGAAAELAQAASEMKAARERRLLGLGLPADAVAAGALAARYHNAELGDLAVQRGPKATVFELTGWSSPVASRRNADGTVSFITVAPSLEGFEFLASARGGKRSLSIRDGAHDYVFTESP